jgi:opacity protein-like surface antigen
MKRMLLAAALAVTAVAPALAADVGVSVSIGQPGFYGRIDIGNYPQPQVIYPQPVVFAPAPYAVVQRPIYLRVPPGHAKNWGKHCGRYAACGQPVYFVQDGWYENVYAPHYREDHRHDRRDRRDDRDEDHRGKGRGHGKHGRD